MLSKRLFSIVNLLDVASIRALRLTVILILTGALGISGGKAGASEEVDLYMVMTMAGVTAGSIKLSIHDQEDQTVSKLAMKSQGLFKLLTGYKSKATARSTSGPDWAPSMPLLYESTYETNSGERRVEIHYDDETGEVDAVGYWKRGEPRETKVPEALQSATVDPLTAMVRFRQWIRALRSTGEVQKVAVADSPRQAQILEVFDGRRRYRLMIEFLERVEVDYADGSVPALRFKVDLEALAGFGKNDMLANWSSEDAQRWIEVLVMDSDDPIPISMSTVGGSLKTTVSLRKVCTGEEDCEKVDG